MVVLDSITLGMHVYSMNRYTSKSPHWDGNWNKYTKKVSAITLGNKYKLQPRLRRRASREKIYKVDNINMRMMMRMMMMSKRTLERPHPRQNAQEEKETKNGPERDSKTLQQQQQYGRRQD